MHLSPVEDVASALWLEIKDLNLDTAQALPLMELVEKFMMESDFDPEEIAEGFEFLVEKGWLVERDDTAFLTPAGIAAL